MAYKIAFIALDSCLGSSITGPMDLFTAANTIARLTNKADPVFEWEIVSEDGGSVNTFNGYPQAVDQSWNDLGKVDLIIIPGIGLEGTEALPDMINNNQSLVLWLKQQAETGVQIAGNCSGNFLMAEAGLLNGHPATTAWWVTDFFQDRYPEVSLQADAILTATDQFICSGSATSSMDMGIYLIERLAGQTLAKQVARYMLVDVNRNTQAAYRLPQPQNSQDPQISKAARFIRRNLKKEISVQGLAEEMHVSTRTLIRKFIQQTGAPPLAFIQKLRIETGKELLENSDLPLEEIIFQIGYQDSSSFRRLFKRQTGLSPREYRRKFTINPVS